MRLASLALLAALVSSGCNSASPAGADGAVNNLSTPAGVCAEWMKLTGDYLNRCTTLATPRDTASWQPYGCPRLLASIAAGRVTFDAALAAPCFEGFPECSGVRGIGCSGTTPNVALGGACSVFALAPECKGNAFCLASAAGSCMGTCTAQRPHGEACATTDECIQPASCDQTGHCGPIEPASTRPTGACTPGRDVCVVGTVCNPATQQCEVARKPGETCGAAANLACGLDSSARCDTVTGTCTICGP